MGNQKDRDWGIVSLFLIFQAGVNVPLGWIMVEQALRIFRHELPEGFLMQSQIGFVTAVGTVLVATNCLVATLTYRFLKARKSRTDKGLEAADLFFHKIPVLVGILLLVFLGILIMPVIVIFSLLTGVGGESPVDYVVFIFRK